MWSRRLAGIPLPYVVVVAAALVAVGASYALEALSDEAILMPSLVVVAATAALAGARPALTAGVVSTVGLLPLALGDRAGDLLRWVTFVGAAALLVALGHRLDRTRRREDALQEELDAARRRFAVAQ